MSLHLRYIDFDITFEWQSTMAIPHRSAKHFWKTLVLDKTVVEVLTRSCNSMLGTSALTEFWFADIRRTRERKKNPEVHPLPSFLPPQAMIDHEHRMFQLMATNYFLSPQRHNTAGLFVSMRRASWPIYSLRQALVYYLH